MFFGVAAARCLCELVEQAFETETARLRDGGTDAAMPTTGRRTASNSFGIGRACGIAAKLWTPREAREAALRGASGHHLVVAKVGVLDAKLAKLVLRFRTSNAVLRVKRRKDIQKAGSRATWFACFKARQRPRLVTLGLSDTASGRCWQEAGGAAGGDDDFDQGGVNL